MGTCAVHGGYYLATGCGGCAGRREEKPHVHHDRFPSEGECPDCLANFKELRGWREKFKQEASDRCAEVGTLRAELDASRRTNAAVLERARQAEAEIRRVDELGTAEIRRLREALITPCDHQPQTTEKGGEG